MLMEYIALLKDGVPASQRGAAAPLFENAPEYAFEGGKFEHLAMLMMKYVSEFLAGRQRELVVKQNEANGWVSPEKGYAFGLIMSRRPMVHRKPSIWRGERFLLIWRVFLLMPKRIWRVFDC